MKKLLKPIILTLIVLSGLTFGAIFLLTKGEEETGEFGSRRYLEQSDQEDEHAYKYDTDSSAIPLIREGDNKNVLNFDTLNQFSITNTKAARERIERLKRRKAASYEDPLIALDPFGTVPNSYFFYFKTPQNCMIKVTITVADEKIPDLIRYIYNGEPKNTTREHEFLVTGLIPGMTNYIIIEQIDENGSHREDRTYKVDVPEEKMPARFSYERGKSDLRLQNGTFFVFPNDQSEIYMYDNNGTSRGMLATDGAHGRRIYSTDKYLIYQVSGSRIVRIDRLGQVDAVGVFSGYDDIYDFAYDGYEHVFALIKNKGRYAILRTSMKGGNTELIYTFDKGVQITSISGVSAGNLYASSSSPAGIIRLDGLVSQKPRIGIVVGKTSDWKKTSAKKRIIDPSIEKKKTSGSSDDETGSDETGTDETASENPDETAAGDSATGSAADAGYDPPVVGWDMSDVVLDLVEDESDGKTDTLSFAVHEDDLVHAVKVSIENKKKKKDTKALTMFDKEVEFDGKVFVQWGQRESVIITNGSRGRFEERDELFKVTREFDTQMGLGAVWKLNLEGMRYFG